ncbi:hypothetical protein [Bartonella sp. B1098]|uniref:hypothetical protein n=1 Tax=Bartonella sp. B1098 TaxID=2911421 RepID=UPI0020C5899D|nr:hypothetical protein [Bartonella sp. B1098]
MQTKNSHFNDIYRQKNSSSENINEAFSKQQAKYSSPYRFANNNPSIRQLSLKRIPSH